MTTNKENADGWQLHQTFRKVHLHAPATPHQIFTSRWWNLTLRYLPRFSLHFVGPPTCPSLIDDIATLSCIRLQIFFVISRPPSDRTMHSRKLLYLVVNENKVSAISGPSYHHWSRTCIHPLWPLFQTLGLCSILRTKHFMQSAIIFRPDWFFCYKLESRPYWEYFQHKILSMLNLT